MPQQSQDVPSLCGHPAPQVSRGVGWGMAMLRRPKGPHGPCRAAGWGCRDGAVAGARLHPKWVFGGQLCPPQPEAIACQGQGLPWCKAANTLPQMGQQQFASLEEPASGCERVAEPGTPAHTCARSCTCLAHRGMCREWADPHQQHVGSICNPCPGPSASGSQQCLGQGCWTQGPQQAHCVPRVVPPELSPHEQCSPGARTGRAGSLPQPVISALIGSPAVPLHQG